MVREFEVWNSRGIRHAKMEGFSRLNLLLGKNSVGKSALLVALFLLAGMSHPDSPLRINRLRGYTRND